MSEEPVSADRPEPSPAQAKAETRAAEAAAIRRRWITLGELLAVLAVVISALTLWNNWSDRRESKAELAAKAQQATTRAATLVLVADAGKRKLTLKPAAAEQTVQSQTLLFPSALGVQPVETTGEPRIEGDWFERALKKAREAAGLPDDSRGDERLPVAIVTEFLANGDPHEDVALYDIGYTISGGGLLGGHEISLRGLSLVAHAKRDGIQARLDARWAKLVPAKTK